MNDPLVKIEHLTKRFSNNPPVLNGIDLDVYKGEIIAFIGPSGTGKSTLLRCLNYLTEPTEGTVSIDNVSITAGTQTPSQIRELRKHSAMVFQNYNLFKKQNGYRKYYGSPDRRSRHVEKGCDYTSYGSVGQGRHVGAARLLSVKTFGRTTATNCYCSSRRR